MSQGKLEIITTPRLRAYSQHARATSTVSSAFWTRRGVTDRARGCRLPGLRMERAIELMLDVPHPNFDDPDAEGRTTAARDRVRARHQAVLATSASVALTGS